MPAYRDRLVSIWGEDASDSSQTLAWIKNAVASQAHEDMYWEFKLKADHTKAALDQNDKDNIGKSVSAFANTAGGVILWGIHAKSVNKEDPDVAQSLRPIQNLSAFVTNLNSVCGGATSPPVAGIENWPVPLGPGMDCGYVLTIVPPIGDSLTQAAMGKHAGKFFLRTGSGVAQIPQVFFAEFFSRRPLPDLRFEVHLDEPSQTTVEETVIEAEHWPEKMPSRFAPPTPWGRCTHRQSLKVGWSLTVTNRGKGTAFDLVITGSCRSEKTQDFRISREHGEIDRILHPGQSLVVHKGSVLIEAAAFETRATCPDVVIEATAYAQDCPCFSFTEHSTGTELVSKYKPGFQAKAPPVTRMVPRPQMLDFDIHSEADA